MAQHSVPENLSGEAFLQYQHYAVIGAGLSGHSASKLLVSFGKTVTLYDDMADPANETFAPLRELGVQLRFGKDQPLAEDIQAVVTSPAIAEHHPLHEAARKRGIPIRGELELGYICSPGARFAAITGTNGKTTVTMLMQKILADAGLDSVAAGNIGLPVAQVALERGPGSAGLAKVAFACEVSSFQLETIEKFCPEVAIILNVTPDHLDRHGTMDDYAALKGRVTENQGPRETLVINQDDPYCLAIGARSKARVRRFSLERPVDDGAWLDGDLIMLKSAGSKPHVLMPMSDLKLIGLHNVANAMAAACAADAMGIPRKKIAQTLSEFGAAPHRLELVATINGVAYVNDSKGTNLGAVERALECFNGAIHLIAGGRDKASPFETMIPKLKERVKAAYLIGEAAVPMERAWAGTIECIQCGTMDRALEEATKRASEGEVILLSPGCASFDQFKSYAHRGEVFRAWVRNREASQ
ncbi:UDP-N-acetylmuramoyl-L-alanine--D-glutamate ligase [bacterium]|nr:UDP-N-acetylmuramoyl-L-alanine--D-glutamate ligase [bacterium]